MIGSKLNNFRVLRNVRLASSSNTAASQQLAGKDIEWTRYEAEVDKVKMWWRSARWDEVERKYTPEDVVSLRGNDTQEYPSNAAATKAYKLFRKLQAEGKATATFGALDTVQVTQMAKYLPVRCCNLNVFFILFSFISSHNFPTHFANHSRLSTWAAGNPHRLPQLPTSPAQTWQTTQWVSTNEFIFCKDRCIFGGVVGSWSLIWILLVMCRYCAQQSGSAFQGATLSRQETTACSLDHYDVCGARIFSTSWFSCSNHCRRGYGTRWYNSGKVHSRD